jgi:hypothetical protein
MNDILLRKKTRATRLYSAASTLTQNAIHGVQTEVQCIFNVSLSKKLICIKYIR